MRRARDGLFKYLSGEDLLGLTPVAAKETSALLYASTVSQLIRLVVTISSANAVLHIGE